MNFDTDADENDNEAEPEEPIPLAVERRRYPVWYYAGKLKQLASENKVKDDELEEMNTILLQRSFYCRHRIQSIDFQSILFNFRFKKRSITSTMN
jgi:hypothetical protein